MKAKWNEKCWNCGSRNMFDMRNYARCEDCGATATPLAKVGVYPIMLPGEDDPRATLSYWDKGNSPSPALVRKIELERSQKSAQGVKSKG